MRTIFGLLIIIATLCIIPTLDLVFAAETAGEYIDRKSVQDKWTPKQDYKNKQFDFIISIPCYDEYDYLFKTLKSINNQNQKILDNTLVSIVINNSEKEIDEIIYNNWKTYEKILQSKFRNQYEIKLVEVLILEPTLNRKMPEEEG